jgi:hypothetical protein
VLHRYLVDVLERQLTCHIARKPQMIDDPFHNLFPDVTIETSPEATGKAAGELVAVWID